MVSFLAALEIQTNGENIICSSYGHDPETQKWAGAVGLYRNGFLHKYILSSEPIYDSMDQAIAAMQAIVSQIRAQELSI